jgi:hypothetical protein
MQCSSECCGHGLAAVSRQRKSHRRPVFDKDSDEQTDKCFTLISCLLQQ